MNDNRPNTVWFNRGVEKAHLGRFQEAIECYNRALEIDPDDAEVLNSKAGSHAELKEFTQALSCLERALTLRRDYANAWLNQGVTLMRMFRRSDAIKSLLQATRLAPDDGEAWLNLGGAYCNSNEFDKGLECFAKAQSLGHPQAADHIKRAQMIKRGRR